MVSSPLLLVKSIYLHAVRTLAEPARMVTHVLLQAVEAAREKATSVTHKKAYDRFLRRCTSKKHFRPSLSGDRSERCLQSLV